MAIGSPTDGPIDVVQNVVLLYIMASQAKEISFLDFRLPAGFLRPAYPCPVLSKRRQGVACGVACSMAEQAV